MEELRHAQNCLGMHMAYGSVAQLLGLKVSSLSLYRWEIVFSVFDSFSG